MSVIRYQKTAWMVLLPFRVKVIELMIDLVSSGMPVKITCSVPALTWGGISG